MSAVATSAKGRKKKAEGRRAGDVVTPHRYGFKRFVWGETFRFGYEKGAATARCLRLLAYKTEIEAKGQTGWTAETKANAWRIAKGEDEASAPAPASEATSASRVDSGTLKGLGYEVSSPSSDDAPESTPAPTTNKPTLYAALDAYVAHIEATNGKAGDHSFAGRVKAQRRAIADLPLERIGAKELSRLVAYWRAKPSGTKTVYVKDSSSWRVIESGEPLSALSVKANIGAARQFFNWLASEESGYAWTAPNLAAIFRLTKGDVERLKGASEELDEIQAMNDAASIHFDADELRALWKACGIYRQRRLYFLLALNCGCATSELSNLRVGHCFLEGDRPFVSFKRPKTKVVGKWYLWAETAKELREHIARRNLTDRKANIFLSDDGNTLLTKSPGGYRNDSVKQVWKRWAKGAKVARLSWKYLRKTGSQYVRESATALGLDGDYISDLYLAHIAPAMSRHYNKRGEGEYDQLGRVLAEVRKRLASVFAKPQTASTKAKAA